MDSDMRRNYPDIWGKYSYEEVLYLDCRGVGDPARDKTLRDHIGTNPLNLEHMAKSQEWKIMYEEAHRLIGQKLTSKKTEKVLVASFCKSGRHRSVATDYVLATMCEEVENITVSLENLSEGTYWSKTCRGECDSCKLATEEAEKTYLKAMKKYEEQWREMPSWGVKTSSEASQPSDGPTRRVEVTHERSRGRSSS